MDLIRYAVHSRIASLLLNFTPRAFISEEVDEMLCEWIKRDEA